MSLSFKYMGDVNPDLKKEIFYFGKWLRNYYEFPNPLEIRLIDKQVLIDFDGTECALRFWQNSSVLNLSKERLLLNRLIKI